MERSTGVAASRMLAGLQILGGYFSVAPRQPESVAAGPIDLVGGGGMPSRAPAPAVTDVTFGVRPPFIENDLRLIFRGTRDPRSGCLVGEIVPDLQMRVLSLVPGAAFAMGGVGAIVAAVLLPAVRGGQPSLFVLVWASMALLVMFVWTRGCGTAVHDAVLNVHRDSPGAHLSWHLGLRWGSRSNAPPPPASVAVGGTAVKPSWPGPVSSGLAADKEPVRSNTSAWLGLLGLVVPIAIVILFILPYLQSRDDRADWVRIDGVAGAEVDPDHSLVTYALPDGTEETNTVPVLRTLEEGDPVQLYFPPGRPYLIEQDRSGFVLPYIVLGGFAAVMTAFIIGRFVIALRRSRQPVNESG